ncbi:MAG: GerW family sporulation protein [Lachnospiraceae bacterium]|nr:GerW family sporulation protein [Lachnospiraceae bacterium]
MAEHFQGTVESLFKGMESFVTTKTCVGDPVYIGDTIIVPLVDVSFGVMASAKNEDRRSNGGGGMGGKITPTALLVIKDGATKLVNIRNQDSLSKLIDMAPDLINKFTSRDKVVTTPEEDSVMAEAAKDEERF